MKFFAPLVQVHISGTVSVVALMGSQNSRLGRIKWFKDRFKEWDKADCFELEREDDGEDDDGGVSMEMIVK